MEQEKITEVNDENRSYPAVPVVIPESTYWTFGAAVGFFFLLFGFLSSIIVSATGFIIMIISFSGWIVNINYDFDTDPGTTGNE